MADRCGRVVDSLITSSLHRVIDLGPGGPRVSHPSLVHQSDHLVFCEVFRHDMPVKNTAFTDGLHNLSSKVGLLSMLSD